MPHPLQRSRSDFVLEWYSGSGAGGQHRNKHQNCCRITDKITGLSAIGTESRSRATNQRTAFRRLSARLLAHYSDANAPERRQTYHSSEVRKYHAADNYVKDHASGERTPFDEKCLVTLIPESKIANA